MTSLQINQLASRSGVPATTLRYYEQVGLLPADRTPAGYRIYDEHALERLRFITSAKRLHLSLDAIRALLSTWEEQPCKTVKAQLRLMLTERIEQTHGSIRELTELVADLEIGLVRLDSLPDREHRCDASCELLPDGPSEHTVPTRTESAASVIACSLSGPDQRRRLAQWHALLADAPRTTTTDGVTLTLPADVADRVAALIVAEQECCPFLDFALTFAGPTIALTVSAEDAALLEPLVPVRPYGCGNPSAHSSSESGTSVS